MALNKKIIKGLAKAALKKVGNDLTADDKDKAPIEKEEELDNENKKLKVTKTLDEIFDELKSTNYFGEDGRVDVNSGWHDDYDPNTKEDQELDAKEKEAEDDIKKDNEEDETLMSDARCKMFKNECHNGKRNPNGNVHEVIFKFGRIGDN